MMVRGATLFGLPSRAEELFRDLHGSGVQAPGHRPAALAEGTRVVEGSPESGDRIEKHHHVPAGFEFALGPLDREHSEPAVGVHVHVVAGGENLGGDVSSKVGDFFRTFIDQERNHVNVRMVVLDAHRDLLKQNRLSRFRRGHDQAAGSEANRAEEIDEAAGGWAALVFERQSRGRINRRQVLECLALPVGLDLEPFDAEDFLNGWSRWSTSRTASTSWFLLDDLDFQFLRRPERELVQQFSGDVRIVIGLDEPVGHLAEPGFGALRKIKNAGETRHAFGN